MIASLFDLFKAFLYSFVHDQIVFVFKELSRGLFEFLVDVLGCSA